jgi:hypothetical protein
LCNYALQIVRSEIPQNGCGILKRNAGHEI